MVGPGQSLAQCAPGKAAPKFEAKNFYDQTRVVKSGDLFSGKTTILSFFATWCRPCKEEIPEFRALTARYSDRGFQTVLVSLDRDKRDVETFLKAANSGDLLVLLDGERKIKELYAVSQLPTNVRIDPDGCIGDSWFGFLPAKLQQLEAHLKKLPKLSP
jgi:peroxiredoxin